MRIANRSFPAVLAFAALGCAPAVSGYSDPYSPVVSAPTVRASNDQAPPERTQGPIAYVVGGIGADEAEAMRQAEASYPLTLELAAPGGGRTHGYIADARVQIHDTHGQALLSTRVDGPLIFIRLPSGSYAVEVDWNGAVKRRMVALTPGKRQHIVFEFPREDPAP